MTGRNRISWLGVFAAFCLLASAALFLFEIFRYSQTYTRLPAGLTLGGVPVGGLDEAAALQQLVTAYDAPVELRYRDELILLEPDVVGFQVNTGVMLPQAIQSRSNAAFWDGLWDYLWLRPPEVRDVPLRAAYSQERLRAFLLDLAARYDRPGSPPQPDASQLGFKPGAPGHTLNVDAALELIDAALYQPRPEDRAVVLPVQEQTSIQPSYATLADLLRENTRSFPFDGVLSLYLYDLNTGEELSLTLVNGEPVTGPVAFSGMSTIKIPIMASFFTRNAGTLSEGEALLLQRSIEESGNTATDLLLKTIGGGDGLDGTLAATDDMRRLGLVNTYISGLLDVQGRVLTPFATPANSRPDLNLRPDPYNQTTAEDMGVLLTMIHQCSQGGGALLAAYPGEVTAEECQRMVQLLTQNQVGPIFIAGGTPGGVVAHKHGWDTVPLTNVGDAALVYTPGGDYALTIYAHRAETIGFEEANRLLIATARAIYNYYNGQVQP